MFPQKVKDINLYNDGSSHIGVITEYTPLKIAMATMDHRGGGMLGALKLDVGLEPLDFEWTLGGWNSAVVAQLGVSAIDGVLLRAVGALQADDGSPVSAVEAVMMGRHTEIDFGTFKPAGETEKKIKTAVAYYKLIFDGRTLLEIDVANGKYIVDGVDRYAEVRAAIGG